MADNTKDETKNNVTPKDGERDILAERLDAIENGLKADLEASRKETQELKDALKESTKRNNTDQDEVVDTERRSAHIMELPVINGAPVVKSTIESVLGIPGIEMIARVETAAGDKFELPFGCDIKKVDFSSEKTEALHKVAYENLKTEKFELVDIDPNDLTGASKVEKGVLVNEGALIAEVDRSTGVPVATGRKIRASVKKDIRHYTIKFNGKKFTLTNEDLANIRI